MLELCRSSRSVWYVRFNERLSPAGVLCLAPLNESLSDRGVGIDGVSQAVYCSKTLSVKALRDELAAQLELPYALHTRAVENDCATLTGGRAESMRLWMIDDLRDSHTKYDVLSHVLATQNAPKSGGGARA